MIDLRTDTSLQEFELILLKLHTKNQKNLGKNPLPISLFSYCYFQIKFPPFLERHPARWVLLLTIWLKVAFCWNSSTYLVTQFYDQTTTEKRKSDVFVIGHNCRMFLKRRPKTPLTKTKTPWTRTKTPWLKQRPHGLKQRPHGLKRRPHGLKQRPHGLERRPHG